MQTAPGPQADKIFALAFTLLFILIIVGLMITIWGMIFSKAGYSFWMALLMLIPIVNLIWLLIFAFSKWPVVREVETYRQRYGSLQQGFQVAPAGYAGAQAYPPAPPPQV